MDCLEIRCLFRQGNSDGNDLDRQFGYRPQRPIRGTSGLCAAYMVDDLTPGDRSHAQGKSLNLGSVKQPAYTVSCGTPLFEKRE